MKTRIGYVLIMLSGILLSSFAGANAQEIDSPQQSLKGDAAIESLKRTGRYDSLVDAYQESRRRDERTEGAIGTQVFAQTAAFFPADIDINDNDVAGSSIAISGNTVVMGSPGFGEALSDQGAVYIFVRSGTTWAQQAMLKAPDAGAGDLFGRSVDIDGDTVIVGSPLHDVQGHGDQGSAYIYVRSGTTWTLQAQIWADDGGGGEFFGNSVAISGDSVICGAPYDEVFADVNDSGSAYVFVRSGTIWAQQDRLEPFFNFNVAAGDNLGLSVAIDGDTAVAGAPFKDFNGVGDSGAAWVFRRTGTSWFEDEILFAGMDAGTGDQFGTSVAVSGDTIAVGVPRAVVGPNDNQGSVRIFVESGASWPLQAVLTAPSGGAAFDFFGSSVALDGDNLAVGAPGMDVTNTNQGAAFFFQRPGVGWQFRQRFTASSPAEQDEFGTSVAILGNFLAVGIPRADLTPFSRTNLGSGVVFRVLADAWTREDKETGEIADGNRLGSSVSIWEDRAVIGAPGDDFGGNTDQGSVYVFERSGSGWTQVDHFSGFGSAAGDNFGASVSLNGFWLAVGAPNDDVGANIDQGSVYLLNHVASGQYVPNLQLTASDGLPFDRMGSSVIMRDAPEPALKQVIAGAPSDDVGVNSDQGSAYIFTVNFQGSSEQGHLFASDGAAGDRFGTSVGISGNKAIVGADFDDAPNSNQGSAYIFTRSGTTWSQEQHLVDFGGASDDRFGVSVSIHEGTAVVGAFGDDVGNTNQGSVFVYTYNGSTWSLPVHLTAADGASGDQFGKSVSISGDLLIVGADFDDIGANASQGSAYIFERVGTTWTQKGKVTDSEGGANDHFGTSVDISGDKAVVGAPDSDAPFLPPPRTDGFHKTLSPTASNQGAGLLIANFLAPTAAGASVSGRVFANEFRGLQNAIVALTDPHGRAFSARTTSMGYFLFEGIPAGETYFLTVRAKGYAFSPRVVSVMGDLTEVDIFASP